MASCAGYATSDRRTSRLLSYALWAMCAGRNAAAAWHETSHQPLGRRGRGPVAGRARRLTELACRGPSGETWPVGSDRHAVRRGVDAPLPQAEAPMIRRDLSALCGALALLGFTTHALTAQERRYVDPTLASDTTTFPYSEGVLVGSTLYLSGTIGLLPDNKVPDTVAEEALTRPREHEGYPGGGRHDHGRSRVGAGVLLRPVDLRRVQPGLPHLLHEGILRRAPSWASPTCSTGPGSRSRASP